MNLTGVHVKWLKFINFLLTIRFNTSVEVIIDGDLWESEAFQFHPLVNTSTLVISRDNLQRFLDKTGHEMQILDVPGLK
jgi:hypothetical protein